jgi:hypothetical protein
MMRLLKTLAAGAAALALVAGLSASARADIAYAFAEETISNLSISPVGSLTNISPVTTGTTAGASLNGSGPATSDFTDALQASIGSPLPGGTLPTGPTDFTRGDVLISNLNTPTNSGQVVAESYITKAGLASGSGGLTASLSFTPTVATALTIAYNFNNDIYVATSGTGKASASFKFDITIKDAAGNIAFDSNTASTNRSIASPPQGFELTGSGTESVTSGTLLAGQQYTLVFSENANTFVSVAAVPEPGPIALAAVAGGLTIVTGAIRRLRRRASK